MAQLEITTLRTDLEDRRRRLVAARRNDPSAHLADLLREVDSALARAATGSFGICEECHEEIEESRLAADPLVRVCLGCLSPEERQALECDLELAARIQKNLLPARSTVHAGWETYYHYEPLGPVSGDHCDVILPDTPEGDLLFFFGDVSGKGVAASILMAHLQATFRSLAGVGMPLSDVMRRANHLFAGSTPSSTYATLVCGRLSPDGRTELANAGHVPPLLKLGRRIVSIEATGLPLGMFSSGEFATRRFDLSAGDLLFLYTDGLTDAGNGREQHYDTARISDVLANTPSLSPRRATRACLDDLSRFRNGTPREDDLTVMAIQRRGHSALSSNS